MYLLTYLYINTNAVTAYTQNLLLRTHLPCTNVISAQTQTLNNKNMTKLRCLKYLSPSFHVLACLFYSRHDQTHTETNLNYIAMITWLNS